MFILKVFDEKQEKNIWLMFLNLLVHYPVFLANHFSWSFTNFDVAGHNLQ